MIYFPTLIVLVGILFCSKNPTGNSSIPVKCYMTNYSIYSSQGVLGLSVDYQFDGKWRILNETIRINNRIMEYSINEYDSLSNRTRRSTYSADSVLTYYTLYENGVFGKETKESKFSPDSVLIEYSTYEYDAKHFLIKYSQFFSDGTFYYYLYENDENGRVTRSTAYDAGNNITGYSTYEYVNGKMTRMNDYDPSRSIVHYAIREYDSNGYHVKTNHFNSDGSLSQYDLFRYLCDNPA
jgi:hypothetical protein